MRHWAEREGHKDPIALHRQSDAVRHHKINWVTLPERPARTRIMQNAAQGFRKSDEIGQIS